MAKNLNDKKYGAVMAELRTKFPSCTNFVITEIDWEAWLRSMIGSTAKPTLELPNQRTGMYSMPTWSTCIWSNGQEID